MLKRLATAASIAILMISGSAHAFDASGITNDAKATMATSISIHRSVCKTPQSSTITAIFNQISNEVSEDEVKSKIVTLSANMVQDMTKWCDIATKVLTDLEAAALGARSTPVAPPSGTTPCKTVGATKVCSESARAYFNKEFKVTLTAPVDAARQYLKKIGVATPDALYACRVLSNRTAELAPAAAAVLSAEQLSALPSARITASTFDPKTDSVTCDYISRVLMGSPGKYEIGPDKSIDPTYVHALGIGRCLPQIARIINEYEYIVERQTTAMVVVTPKLDPATKELDELSFHCDTKGVVNIVRAHNSCRLPRSFYREVSSIVQPDANRAKSLGADLQSCVNSSTRSGDEVEKKARTGNLLSCTHNKLPANECTTLVIIWDVTLFADKQ